MRDVIGPFVAGAITLLNLVASLFFLKFWKATHDRLFAIFAAAFAVLALQRFLLVLTAASGVGPLWLYAVRFAGYAMILWAIIDKNRATPNR